MVDLSGGLDEGREFFAVERPDDPDWRESVNVWVWDDRGRVGLPRLAIEAVGADHERNELQLNVALADGRVVCRTGHADAHDRESSAPTRALGAGPLVFELVEPFRRWRASFDGTATATSTTAQIGGWRPGDDGPEVPVALELDIVSAVPPWEAGTLLEEAGHVLRTQDEGLMMGGPRFEQLFRATGTLSVDGHDFPFDGGGLRIRRSGYRRMAAFRGHVWQSALFPSGRGFGLCVYLPRTDGLPTFNEGYLFDGDGGLVPARVVDAPWLGELRRGADAGVVLEATDGRSVTIVGTTELTTCMVIGGSSDTTGAQPDHRFRIEQSIARYTMDGETAFGMIERSSIG